MPADLTLRITDHDGDVLLVESQPPDEHFVVLVTVGPGADFDIGARKAGLTLEDLEALSEYASIVSAARRMAEYRLHGEDT